VDKKRGSGAAVKFTAPQNLFMGTSKNSRLCVTRPRQNAHLPNVNSAFVAGASLDFGVFRGSLLIYLM
jgi:hypothetical protein